MLQPELFNDVENAVLRAYNRTITAVTLFREDGKEATTEYLGNFAEKDRLSIVAMLIRYRQDPDGLQREVRGIAHAVSQ